MKNFKFLNGYQPIQRDRYNGATDPYLIQLTQEISSYSDWIYSVMITSDDGDEILIIEFKDLDNCKYLCEIYQDLSFSLLQIIEDEFGEDDLIEPFDIPNEISSDHNRILNYLKNMPRTIASSL